MADHVQTCPDPEVMLDAVALVNKERKILYPRRICQHDKYKFLCMLCNGVSLCKPPCPRAGKNKAYCMNCNGKSLCQAPCPRAGKAKSNCMNCNGRSLCQAPCPRAGKSSAYCMNCNGRSLCQAPCPRVGKAKATCVNCSGKALCQEPCINAGKAKVHCMSCCGSGLCQDPCSNAGKQKVYCVRCGGSALCKSPCVNAGKQKVYCPECGGSGLCKVCRFTIVRVKDGMCKKCAPVARKRSRCREARMAAKLDVWARDDVIPRYTLWNKQNPMADPAQCGKYRVDFVFQHAIGVVLLEYDEQMHADRVLRCELVRQAEVALGYGGLPVHWIRFNPDAFKIDGVTRMTKRGEREKELLKQLQRALSHADYEHPIKVTYICYHQTKSGDHVENELAQTHKFKSVEAYNVWVETVS